MRDESRRTAQTVERGLHPRCDGDAQQRAVGIHAGQYGRCSEVQYRDRGSVQPDGCGGAGHDICAQLGGVVYLKDKPRACSGTHRAKRNRCSVRPAAEPSECFPECVRQGRHYGTKRHGVHVGGRIASVAEQKTQCQAVFIGTALRISGNFDIPKQSRTSARSIPVGSADIRGFEQPQRNAGIARVDYKQHEDSSFRGGSSQFPLLPVLPMRFVLADVFFMRRRAFACSI